MTEKTSKVAIATGASRGIGAAVAERLAGDGFTIVGPDGGWINGQVLRANGGMV